MGDCFNGSRKTLRVPLRVVFYREGGSWIAHCLEFDLLGDGTTKPEALETLFQAVVLQAQASVEHNNLANLFSPADGKYFRMYAAGVDVAMGLMELSIERLRSEAPMIEDIEAREYEDCDSELTLA